MIRNKQLVLDKEKGDCFRAAITSILDIPNDPKLAVGGDPDWFARWYMFLYGFGLALCYEQKAIWRDGYWIASVPSLNLPGECTHAIVMYNHKVAFDPSTKKRYKRGTSLLGKNIVLGAHFLEVRDASKLHKLVEYQREKQL